MENDKDLTIVLKETPIELGSLVIRAWKVDPAYQYEVGIVTEVTQSPEIHDHDVRVTWQRGFKTGELLQELYHVELSDVN
tara:strand:- start:197 stop:436 length:240 start_codon:yes stop_codon:yes gene_type:complete